MCLFKPKKKFHIKKTNRPIDLIILHCSATMPHMDIGVKEVRKWHKARGWSDIGYHFVIRRDGELEIGRDLDKAGAHTKGYNARSIGICMVGGVDEYNDAQDNFTVAQWDTARQLLTYLEIDYPHVTIAGHNEYANKACPSFDVQKELNQGRLR